MSTTLSPSAQRVQNALEKLNLPCQVVEMPASTRTAAEAAAAIGCQVAQIVKSLLFRCQTSGKAILVLASGVNRVNESLLAEYCGEPIYKADAAFVLEQTGFAIGGVPPLGHVNSIDTYIDHDLLQWEEVWAAAGTPHAVFALNPQDLERMTNGQVLSIT